MRFLSSWSGNYSINFVAIYQLLVYQSLVGITVHRVVLRHHVVTVLHRCMSLIVSVISWLKALKCRWVKSWFSVYLQVYFEWIPTSHLVFWVELGVTSVLEYSVQCHILKLKTALWSHSSLVLPTSLVTLNHSVREFLAFSKRFNVVLIRHFSCLRFYILGLHDRQMCFL